MILPQHLHQQKGQRVMTEDEARRQAEQMALKPIPGVDLKEIKRRRSNQ